MITGRKHLLKEAYDEKKLGPHRACAAAGGASDRLQVQRGTRAQPQSYPAGRDAHSAGAYPARGCKPGDESGHKS